jgi:hypothetical protein
MKLSNNLFYFFIFSLESESTHLVTLSTCCRYSLTIITWPTIDIKGWHYTSSPFISSPVISSRSFRPLIHFVPGHFVPLSHIYRGSCLERPLQNKKTPHTHSPEVVSGFLSYDKWLMVCHVTMVTFVTPVRSVTTVTHVSLWIQFKCMRPKVVINVTNLKIGHLWAEM